jgi:biopolymer transport protein ExbD
MTAYAHQGTSLFSRRTTAAAPGSVMCDINITPLIDVMRVLLEPEIHLRPDRRVKYDYVAQVLASAQHNRMQKMGFVNTAEFKKLAVFGGSGSLARYTLVS